MRCVVGLMVVLVLRAVAKEIAKVVVPLGMNLFGDLLLLNRSKESWRHLIDCHTDLYVHLYLRDYY